ncbi:MAG: hypothetical protein CO090_01765 [Acidobacteria bacterium CG_4_9_14_3_um_filter_49_7]|nr:MAG: hypothetical protein CO090_01765 [Acidobacteria bacterium CG_4_9_14_3_um_filter_49_7]
MQSKPINSETRICPVCRTVILPHEVALFFSGKGNLVQMRVEEDVVLIHEECADSFETRSKLLSFLTNGKDDLSWLE